MQCSDGLYNGIGVFGNVIINQNFLETFGHPSSNMQGVMTSIYNIGCFIGGTSYTPALFNLGYF